MYGTVEKVKLQKQKSDELLAEGEVWSGDRLQDRVMDLFVGDGNLPYNTHGSGYRTVYVDEFHQNLHRKRMNFIVLYIKYQLI